jgi:hypothetical protein
MLGMDWRSASVVRNVAPAGSALREDSGGHRDWAAQKNQLTLLQALYGCVRLLNERRKLDEGL